MKGSAFLLVMALLPALVFADCIGEATRFHQIDVRSVRAIVQAKSWIHVDAVDVNGDGSTDIGLMQISSSWPPSLARYGITRAHLFNACVNAYVGSWILFRNIQQSGLTWDAVRVYNAKGPAKRLTYARKVYQMLAAVSSTPSRVITDLVTSAWPVEAPRATVRRLQTNTSSDIIIVSWEPPNE